MSYYSVRRERGLNLLDHLKWLHIDLLFYSVESDTLDVMPSQMSAKKSADCIETSKRLLKESIEKIPGESTKEMIARKMDQRWLYS